jgi:hypothetical protein
MQMLNVKVTSNTPFISYKFGHTSIMNFYHFRLRLTFFYLSSVLLQSAKLTFLTSTLTRISFVLAVDKSLSRSRFKAADKKVDK